MITANEARKMATSVDVDKKLAPLVESEVSKICHAIKCAAEDGEFKVLHVLKDHLYTRVDKRLESLGFSCRRVWWFWKRGVVKIVVKW